MLLCGPKIPKTKKLQANAGKCSVSVLELSNLLPNGKERNEKVRYRTYEILRSLVTSQRLVNFHFFF